MIQPLFYKPLDQTHLVPPIVKDYLDKSNLLEKYVSSWHQTNGIEEAMANRRFSAEQRVILRDGLNQQYAHADIQLNTSDATFSNIESLVSPNTFTITTGHQLSLFGGTLFMGYKILTAIKLALDLQAKFPSKKFVPILWLASEDHDFEEIKGTYLFGKNLDWHIDSNGKATGQIAIQDMENLLDEIAGLLGNHPHAETWVQKIKEAYLNSENLGKATLRFYHTLFQEFGLVIIDPNRVEYKKILLPVILADVLKQKSYETQLISDQVLATHYKLQIHARPINFFYLVPGGARKLLKPFENGFKAGEDGPVFSVDEMELEINQYPERFSPNVNLRPVFQEMILPNLAYVGGPAEVGYWLQLKSIFDLYETPFPLVALRFMNVLLGGGLKEKVEKMGLEVQDLLNSETELTQKYLLKTQSLNYPVQTQELLDQMQVLIDQVNNMDPGLGKDFLESKLGLKDFFKSKSGAIKRSIEQHEATQIEKLLKFRTRLFPNGVLQERIETVMQYEVMLKEPILNNLLNLIEPLSGKLLFSTY